MAEGKPFRVLAVHGYEMNGSANGTPILGTLAQAVCKGVAQIHQDYDVIFMLGGWHREVDPDVTIGMAMKEELDWLGVPKEKVVLQGEIRDLRSFMPPRDTAEEVQLLSQYLGGLPAELRWRTELDTILVRMWEPRVRVLHGALGIESRNIICVSASVPLVARVQLGIAYILSVLDPLGEGMFGAKFRSTRKSRTLLPATNFRKPLLLP